LEVKAWGSASGRYGAAIALTGLGFLVTLAFQPVYGMSDALVFAADVREDRMRGAPVTVVIPGHSILAVNRVSAGSRPQGAQTGPDLPSRVMPRLRVDTDDGPVFFEAARASRRAEALAERFVGRAATAH